MLVYSCRQTNSSGDRENNPINGDHKRGRNILWEGPVAWKAGHADDLQNVKRRGWKQIRTALTEGKRSEKVYLQNLQFSYIGD